MGREKRIAESRTKEILDKKQGGEIRSDAGRPAAAAAPGIPAAKPVRHTGTAQAIIQIVLLFLVPTFLIIILGKFVFRL